jgi:hypothetical protein
VTSVAQGLFLFLNEPLEEIESHQRRLSMNLRYRIAQLERRIAQLEGSGAPHEEGRFFDNPTKKSVREFAESKAISNDLEVSKESPCTQEEAPQVSLAAPPTPKEIEQKPGGKEFKTLNQFVVETEETVRGVPQGYDEIDKSKGIETAEESMVKNLKERVAPKSEKVKAIKEVMKRKGYRYVY